MMVYFYMIARGARNSAQGRRYKFNLNENKADL